MLHKGEDLSWGKFIPSPDDNICVIQWVQEESIIQHVVLAFNSLRLNFSGNNLFIPHKLIAITLLLI